MKEIDPVVLDRIEAKLSQIESTLRIMLASRLMRDGHAHSWREAVAIARDPALARSFYPEADS